MQLRYLIPCTEFRRNDAGLASIFGGLDFLWFPQFPAVYDWTVAICLEAADSELNHSIPLTLEFSRDADCYGAAAGEPQLLARVQMVVAFANPAPGTPATTVAGVPAREFPFPSPGEYRVTLNGPDGTLGSTRFAVIQRRE